MEGVDVAKARYVWKGRDVALDVSQGQLIPGEAAHHVIYIETG